eukprot:998645-Amphidinium_carterae.1
MSKTQRTSKEEAPGNISLRASRRTGFGQVLDWTSCTSFCMHCSSHEARMKDARIYAKMTRCAQRTCKKAKSLDAHPKSTEHDAEPKKMPNPTSLQGCEKEFF